MPRSCSICTHPENAELDQALSNPAGVIRQIAAKYRVSEDALRRHKSAHLIPEMREKLAADEDLRDVDVLAEMKSLYTRMKAHLEAAEETDNWQAIKAFHSEARQDLELLAKLLGELDEQPVTNILISPQWLELRALIVTALEPYAEAQEAVLKALEDTGNGHAR